MVSPTLGVQVLAVAKHVAAFSNHLKGNKQVNTLPRASEYLI